MNKTVLKKGNSEKKGNRKNDNSEKGTTENE